MADWHRRLIEHLDACGDTEVRLGVQEISDIVGTELPTGAWYGPTGKNLSDYWRRTEVLRTFEDAGWTVDFTDYVALVIGFRHRSHTGESSTQAGSLAATIRHLVSQARRVGTVTSVEATQSLADGTSITLSIDPNSQCDSGDVPQERSQTHQVSPGTAAPAKRKPARKPPQVPQAHEPISRLESTKASVDSIRYDGRHAFHWPIRRADGMGHQAFRRAVRRHVTDIEGGQGLGGYGCLATMSQKKSTHTKTRAIYSPAALGLERVQGQDTLFDLVLQQKIAVVSISGHGYDKADSIRMKIKNTTAQHVRLFVPARTVFEQEATDPNAQDLMLRDPVEQRLTPGKTSSIEAHGLCMDEGRKEPDGETLLLTPWILSIEVATQDELWHITGPDD